MVFVRHSPLSGNRRGGQFCGVHEQIPEHLGDKDHPHVQPKRFKAEGVPLVSKSTKKNRISS